MTFRPLLLVDDSEDDIELTTVLLRKAAGAEHVVAVKTGEHAIDYLTGLAGTPDNGRWPAGIILDVKMPGMNGLELLEWIRQRREYDPLPAVMFSSSDDPRDIQRAAKLGAQCYVGKYPTVQAAREIVAAIKAYSFAPGSAGYFPIKSNLLLGRDALPDLAAT
jgi:CheY-like chemotaxis protein